MIYKNIKSKGKMTRLMRNITLYILFLIMILCVFSGYTIASNHDAESTGDSAWHVQISELNDILIKKQSEKIKLLKQTDKLAKKIIQEKQKSQGISNRKLDSLLRESQQLVSILESVSTQIEKIEGQLKQKYPEAIAALVNLLETDPKEGKKKKQVKQLLNYMKAYEKLSLEKPLKMPIVNLNVQETDTHLDIQKKADFLSDQTALLKAKMFQIDVLVNKLEKEKALRDKVKKFADEINFYDETLFIEEKRLDESEKPALYGANEDSTSVDEKGPILTAEFGLGETSSSFIVQSEISESSASDLIFTSGGIDAQINLLRQQKIQFENQVQQLSEKTQIFYKMLEK